MDDRFNTTAGWVLGAGIVALGATLVTGEYFKHGHHVKGGYEVADAEPAAGGAGAVAAVPIDFSTGDPAKGADVFKKCASCHTITSGGPNGIGPNLYGTMGEEIGKGKGGFAFSPALSGHGGKWDWDTMDKWLTSPAKFAPGTKMSFAGIADPKQRADVIVYLNAQGSNLPVPPPPAAAPAAGPETPAAAAAAPPEGGATEAAKAASNTSATAPASGTPETKGASSVN